MIDHGKAVEALWELDEGQLPEGELAAHLESCPECREEYEKIKKIKAELKSCSEEVPPELEEGVMATVRTEKKKRSFYIPIGTISAAAVILIVFTLGRGLLPGGKSSDMMLGGAPEAEDADRYVPESPLDDIVNMSPSYSDSKNDIPSEDNAEQEAVMETDPFGYVDSVVPPDRGRATLLYTVSGEYLDKVRSILEGAEEYSSDGVTLFICEYTDPLSERIEGLSSGSCTRDADRPVKYFAVAVTEE